MVPMTSGERMKIVKFHDQGWSEAEIASRLNRKRRDGYLKDKNLSDLTPNCVSEWLGFFKGSQVSA